ncbi:NUDIX domain-containing protein [Marinibactrum halimedae]|uniref:ADP-ribose pyrophosphatase n=1 Tax=Marinibactrum halimedae TaxID=1444977 RepID=A0AA37T2F8_9GAMM|nr:NUDIX domain-containing protein [Marinibactrum halimedae]MCD9457747.1 NUDIX domain-containing protein [Marinibactrum halimedae]GLS24879.1 ADP-ribose pyrophosphatase [Marinibactrum halimedae]
MTEFHNKDVEIIQEEIVYNGFFKMIAKTLKHRLFGGGWSPPIRRECFQRGDAVAAILYDPHQDTIGFIEQFRIGALNSKNGPWCLEVVAGMVEAGETPENTLKRELIEEASFTPERLIPICEYFSSPGGCDEVLHVFCAIGDLRHTGGIHGLESESEDIKVHVQPAEWVFENLYRGRFNNAATLIALQWLKLNKMALN